MIYEVTQFEWLACVAMRAGGGQTVPRCLDLAIFRSRAGALRSVTRCLQAIFFGLPRAVERGLEQTAASMDTSGAVAGHLVVFDMRKARSWADRASRFGRNVMFLSARA